MWATIVIVAVPVALYLFALAVNWRDQPPNAEALELAAAATPDPIPDSANAYVYVLGFAVPRVGDPALIGATRADWIRALAADTEIDRASDPYPGSAPEFQQIPEPLAAVLTPCSTPDASCVAAFDAATGTLREQLDAQRPLIERYRTLLGLRAWRDVTTSDARGPLASYAEVGYARRLFLLDTWLLAAAGDVNEVRARLETDLALWRMALAESDSLYSKIIAAAYVRQHFAWGNLILRRLPAERRADGVPEAWRKTLTAAERSLRRTLKNEWRVVNSSIQSMKAHGLAVPRPARVADPRSTFARVATQLELALLQPQATANRYAAVFAKLEKLVNLPYAELGAALEHAPEFDEPPTGVFAVTYNLLGNALATPDPSLLANYGVRIADLEGARRAAMLTVDLRVLKIPAELAGAMIPLAAVRDPYTGGPFAWTAEPATVSFTGLERGPGAHHTFLY